ncbi:hypothetical protein [Halorubrum sp. Ea8]|uniref:hypothetical protein n=1 Tax=Halorubrum sp. Ea8 TaxID=1383841 RepID=UPI0011401889
MPSGGSVNAFNRYKPDGFAPHSACCGDDDRTASIRVPSGTTRIEKPDSDCRRESVSRRRCDASARIRRDQTRPRSWAANG